MLTQTRYIIVFRDSPSDTNRYFGPFASETHAYDFADTLPEPLEKGYKFVKALSPYSHDEANLARDVIMIRRAQGDIRTQIGMLKLAEAEITHN